MSREDDALPVGCDACGEALSAPEALRGPMLLDKLGAALCGPCLRELNLTPEELVDLVGDDSTTKEW